MSRDLRAIRIRSMRRCDDGAVWIGSDRASVKKSVFWGRRRPLILLKEPVEMDAGHGNGNGSVNEH